MTTEGNKKRAEYLMEWHKKNPGKRKKYDEKYRKENQEKEKERHLKYRKENPEKETKRKAKWYKKNKEAINKKQAEYRAKNKDGAKNRNARLYKKNKDKIKTQHKEWRKANPDRVIALAKIHNHNRRARIISSRGRLSLGIEEKLLAFQKGRCAICRTSLKKTGHHLDHIMPLAKGGKNIDSNIQLTCLKCNHEKSAKDPIEFMQSRGYLL